MEKETNSLMKYLPEGFKQACWETKAMERKRGITDEETLLKLCLFYAYDHSLIEVQAYARAMGLADISDVGFMKRFEKCGDWFKWIIQNLKPGEVAKYEKPKGLEEYRVLAVDASDINSKGAVKQYWHLHYAVDLFALSCAEFKLTEATIGETLKNFTLRKKDLILGDRAYASLSGIEYCLSCGADFVMRMKNKSFTLYDEAHNKTDLCEILKNVDKNASDIIVYWKGSDKKFHPLRICAVKKDDAAIEQTKKKLHRKESKSQMKLSDETKKVHEYFFVITSLIDKFSAQQIIDIYKLRWQVEMVFKRFKSILNLGSMPTKKTASSEAWLNCKMLIALLIEKMISIVDFSPYAAKKTELMEGDETDLFFDFDKFIYDY